MVLRLVACQIILDAILDTLFLEFVTSGAHASEVGHRASIYSTRRKPTVNVQLEEWIVELIEEFVESRKPSRVQAFVREAVLEQVARMSCAERRSERGAERFAERFVESVDELDALWQPTP